MQPSPDQNQFSQSQPPRSENPFASAETQALLAKQNLLQAYNLAGGNFYSIAVFSIINTFINFFNGSIYFPIGLGITQIIDAFSFLFQQELPELQTVFFGVGMVLDLIIVGIVALFGFRIKAKQTKPLIVIGGGLYLLDGLLVLIFQDWIGAAFHGYFLFRIWQNWQTIQNLSKTTAPQTAIESPL